jgi:hypothetical protein
LRSFDLTGKKHFNFFRLFSYHPSPCPKQRTLNYPSTGLNGNWQLIKATDDSYVARHDCASHFSFDFGFFCSRSRAFQCQTRNHHTDDCRLELLGLLFCIQTRVKVEEIKTSENKQNIDPIGMQSEQVEPSRYGP